MEIWKDVKGYEGVYIVSDLGNVNRIFSYSNGTVKNRSVSASIGDDGYRAVCLYVNNVRKRKRIHQLVAESFLNHESCGYEIVVDHIDNDPLNNNLSNLQLISQRENNSKDKWRHRMGDVKSLGVQESGNKFSSMIGLNGVTYYLGSFSTELKASEAYRKSLEDYNNGCFEARKYSEYKPASEYKNVSWHKGNGMWLVSKVTDGKQRSYGYFHCEIEASLKAKEINKNPTD